MRFKVELIGDKEAILTVRLYGKAMIQDVRDLVNETGLDVQSDAKINLTMKRSVDTGRLRSSILPQFSEDGLIGAVGTFEGNSEHYGPDIEFGTWPHWIPIKALIGWARRHGINPYAVQRSLAKKGTRARPFLLPAWEVNSKRFLSALSKLTRG